MSQKEVRAGIVVDKNNQVVHVGIIPQQIEEKINNGEFKLKGEF